MRDSYLVTERADIGAVTLLTLCERDVLWGVRESHLGDADPAVTAWLRGADSAGGEHWSEFREWTRTTTGFVLEHLLAYLRGTAGGFSTELPDGTTAGLVLEEICDNQVDLGHHILYEGPDILATLGGSLWAADDDGIHLSVELGSSWVGRVPEALLGLASDGGSFHGAFVHR